MRTDPPTTAEIGQNIRAAREAAGLSREALAEAIGISPKSVQNIEGGLRIEAWPRVAMIADALGADIASLFGREAGVRITPAKLAAAMEPMLEDQLSPEAVRQLVDTALRVIEATDSDLDDEPAPQDYKRVARALLRLHER